MDMKAGLFQQQTLKLQMTQELSQAIALLQYSTQELTEFLENKALENPFLKVELPQVKTMDPRRDHLKIKKCRDKKVRDQQNWMDQLSKQSYTLFDHLHMQIIDRPNYQKLALFLHYIDENGYFIQSKEELARQLQLDPASVEAVTIEIQALQPAGVGAFSLWECLYLQLSQLPKHQELAEELVKNHFNAFAEKKWKELAKQLRVSLTDIQEAYDLIQTLNPRPGAVYQQESATYVIPDVLVTYQGTHVEITIYDEFLPKLTFRQEKFNQFQPEEDTELRKYLQEKQQEYQWMLKSLEQRKETIAKVALTIAERQRDFFINGPTHIQPLTMKEIAEEIGVHESTVSRAVREKYMQTPYGTYELKYFFSQVISSITNEQTSSTKVKLALKKLIDQENKRKPFSDQDLVDILKQEHGFVISRRTVTKYREQLGIGSSSKRKRYE